MDVKVSNSWVDWEKLIYVDEIESKTVYKAEDSNW